MRMNSHGLNRSDSSLPCVGITRIRFKGFVNDVSALRLPRSFLPGRRISVPRVKSMWQSDGCHALDTNPTA
jgi:hypothetical protein